MTKIHLNVDTDGKVSAHEGGDAKNKGNLCMRKKEDLTWEGDYKAGNGEFVVTFDDGDPSTSSDWPFEVTSPPTYELRIPAKNGKEERTVIKPGLWKYSVAYTGTPGATSLDPMIIVRDSSNSFMNYAVPVLAFIAGAVFAAMVLRAKGSRTR